MATQVSVEYKYQKLLKKIDFANDSFKMILMQSGFVYNPVSHSLYADVLASEISGVNGYTAGGLALSGVSVTKNTTDKRGDVAWSNASWTASGGPISASGAIIYDDTLIAPIADLIIGYIDFGGTQTVLDGGTFTIANIKVEEA